MQVIGGFGMHSDASVRASKNRHGSKSRRGTQVAAILETLRLHHIAPAACLLAAPCRPRSYPRSNRSKPL